MNSIDITSNAMGVISFNSGMCSSIMARPISSERKIEIQGFYWPRLLLRNPTALSFGKKDEKKVHKMNQKGKKHTTNSLFPAMKTPLSPSTTNSLLEILHDVPALISDDQVHSRSPITGKPILYPKNKMSILIPTKPVRKQLERRSQSTDTASSLD
jgi:hypothetical protein